MTGSRAGLGAVPRAPSARHITVQPEPRKGGSNWAMSPCSRYKSPPEVELSNIWLALQHAKNDPVTERVWIQKDVQYKYTQYKTTIPHTTFLHEDALVEKVHYFLLDGHLDGHVILQRTEPECLV